MGQRGKTKRSLKRRAEKRARKEQMKARYQGYRDSGDNSKRGKLRRKRAKAGLTTVSHPDGKCGNPGCARCHAVVYTGFLQGGKPFRMPHWMYKRYVSEHKKAA